MKIIATLKLGVGIVSTFLNLSLKPRLIVSAVDKIIPITAGRIPPGTALTAEYFKSFVRSVAINSITAKDGVTIPKKAKEKVCLFCSYDSLQKNTSIAPQKTIARKFKKLLYIGNFYAIM